MDMANVKWAMSFLLPIIIPKVINFLKSGGHSRSGSPRPLSNEAWFSVTTMLCWSGTLLLYGAYYNKFLQPENIVLSTKSRISTPIATVLGRMASRKTSWTVSQRRLADRLAEAGPAGMLLYSVHGPAIGDCEWCSIQSSYSFVLYRAPAVMLPYLINWIALLVLTEARPSRPWRTTGFLFLGGILTLDLYSLFSLSKSNGWVYWSFGLKRLMLPSMLFSILAGLVYLSSRGLMFSSNLDTKENLMDANKSLKQSLDFLNLTATIQAAKGVDETYREAYFDYWKRHGQGISKMQHDKYYQDAIKDAKTRLPLHQLNAVGEHMVKLYRSQAG